MVDTAGITGGIGQVFGGFGGFFNSILEFLARNFFTMVLVVIAGAIGYYIYYRFVLNDIRIIVRKGNGLTSVAIARMIFDKTTQTKKIIISGYKLHDENPPSEDSFFFYKSFTKVYKGYNAIQDEHGVIHFVKPEINLKHEYMLNVVTPTKLEQYFSSRERAWRKFKLKDEQQAKMMMVSLIIFTLIISCSLAWGYYQQKKGGEAMSKAVTSLSAVIDTQNALMAKYLQVSGLPQQNTTGQFQEEQTVNLPFGIGG